MSLDAIQFELRSNKEELQMYRDSMIRSRTKPNTGKVKLYVDKITRLQDELARLKGPTLTPGPAPGPAPGSRFKSRGRSRRRSKSRSRGKQGGSKKRRTIRRRRGSRRRH
jgi:hypothetical protein